MSKFLSNAFERIGLNPNKPFNLFKKQKKNHHNNDLFNKAFDLVSFDSKDPYELLKKLSDVACEWLNGNENVYYFSLPIWNYLTGLWMEPVCSCVNKKNDNEFNQVNEKSQWYKSYEDGSPKKETTYFKFFKEAKDKDNFSFIEFISQKVIEFIPIFTIKITSDGKPNVILTDGSLGKTLEITGNKKDSCDDTTSVDRFITATATLLAKEGKDALKEDQNKDLKHFYTFLCTYQKYFVKEEKLTIYLISSKIFTRSDGSPLGSGGMVLVCINQIPKDTLMFFSMIINMCYRELGGKNWEAKWRKVVVSTAIAQVMARNLSHNYGSHVLNHLLSPSLKTFSPENNYETGCSRQDDNKVIEKQVEETKKQLLFLINSNKDKAEIFSSFLIKTLSRQLQGTKNGGELTENDISNETLRQVVYLLNHIKCRVDYISDISFGAPLLQTTRNVYNDIFREIDRVRLLMNHISGLEKNFKYRIELKGPKGELDEINDLRVAIPNDVVGTHAFYNILENIIRNTAKHAKGQHEPQVIFHIDFSNIIIKDEWEKKLKEEAQQYYCVEIYDNIILDKTTAENLVNAQNKRLNDPIFKEEHPRSHSLGLVEMEASATYLRKLDSSLIDDDLYHVINSEENSPVEYEQYKNLYFNQHNQFNLLKAIMKPGDNEKYYFGYRFFMLRPQEVLIISDKDSLHNPEKGIWVIKKDIFKNDLDEGKVFNHEFIVIENNDDEIRSLIESHKTALTPRILEMDGISFKPEETEKVCWEKWREMNKEKWSYCDFGGSFGGSFDKDQKKAFYVSHMADEDTFKHAKYCEALSSNAQNKLPNFQDNIAVYCDMLSREEHSIIKAKNIESVNNRVVIIDERFQTVAKEDKYEGYPFADHYQKMQVTIPDIEKDCNLSEQDILNSAEKIKKYIKKYIGACSEYDFIVIHYGILERIFKAESETMWQTKMEEFLNNKTPGADQKNDESRPRIVLTSGRGVPDNLPDCVSFVSLSSLTSALIDHKSKYLLNCLMYASRKVGK